MAYRKIPVEVHAVKCVDRDAMEFCAEWVTKHGGRMTVSGANRKVKHPFGLIFTLEGTMTVRQGDYVVRGVAGEFYPVRPDIFEQTYEAAP